MPRPPPRIFIITARDVDAAILFCRGPSDWFHLVKWDMTNDTFESGAWFKGTLYPRKCDLSPDGTVLLYFALQGSRSRTPYSHAWTAVSRAPWMEALGLWPQGTTYGGGGRFISNRHIVIRSGEVTPLPDHPALGLNIGSGSPDEHASSDEIAGASWTGRDRKGRLIYARDGKIFRRPASGVDVELADLSGMIPDPRPAPAGTSDDLE
jgi:hypothetical protein